MAPPELDESLVSKLSQGTKDRVRIHPEDLGEIPGRGQTLSGTGFPFGYRPPDLRRHLLMQWSLISPVELEAFHGANDASTTAATSRRGKLSRVGPLPRWWTGSR
jgi:hypothetical protein